MLDTQELNQESMGHENGPLRKDVTLLEIKRHMIESGDLSEALNALTCKKGTLSAPLHIVVDGYNNDPRELYEIAEVKRFFKRLNKRYSNWLIPEISIDTIMIVTKCLLAVKTERPDGEMGESIRNVYFKEGKWGELVAQWARKSDWGLDYASHLAFEVFPTMCPIPTFKCPDKISYAVKQMMESGYPISQEIIQKKKAIVKVYQFLPGAMEIRVYMKLGHNFIYDAFLINNPNLETEEGANLFKSDFEANLMNVLDRNGISL